MLSLRRGNLTQAKYAEKIHSSHERGVARLSKLFIEKKRCSRVDFRSSEKRFLPKRGHSRSSKNNIGSRVLSGPFLLKEDNFRSSEGIFIQAKKKS